MGHLDSQAGVDVDVDGNGGQLAAAAALAQTVLDGWCGRAGCSDGCWGCDGGWWRGDVRGYGRVSYVMGDGGLNTTDS